MLHFIKSLCKVQAKKSRLSLWKWVEVSWMWRSALISTCVSHKNVDHSWKGDGAYVKVRSERMKQRKSTSMFLRLLTIDFLRFLFSEQVLSSTLSGFSKMSSSLGQSLCYCSWSLSFGADFLDCWKAEGGKCIPLIVLNMAPRIVMFFVLWSHAMQHATRNEGPVCSRLNLKRLITFQPRQKKEKDTFLD